MKLKCTSCNKYFDKFHEKCPFCGFDLYYKDKYDIFVFKTFPSKRLLATLSEITQKSTKILENEITRRDLVVVKFVSLSKATRIRQQLIKAGARVKINHSLKEKKTQLTTSREESQIADFKSKSSPKEELQNDEKNKQFLKDHAENERQRKSDFSIFANKVAKPKQKKQSKKEKDLFLIILALILFFSFLVFFLKKDPTTVNYKSSLQTKKKTFKAKSERKILKTKKRNFLKGKEINPLFSASANYKGKNLDPELLYEQKINNLKQAYQNSQINLSKYQDSLKAIDNSFFKRKDLFLNISQKRNFLEGKTNLPNHTKLIIKFIRKDGKVKFKKALVNDGKIKIKTNFLEKGQYLAKLKIANLKKQHPEVQKALEKIPSLDLQKPIKTLDLEIVEPDKIENMAPRIKQMLGDFGSTIVYEKKSPDYKELNLESQVKKTDENEFIFKVCASLISLKASQKLAIDNLRIKTKNNIYDIPASILNSILLEKGNLSPLELSEKLYNKLK